MNQEQGKKAADKSVSPVANDNVHRVEQAAAQMQRLVISDGSEEVPNDSLLIVQQTLTIIEPDRRRQRPCSDSQ